MSESLSWKKLSGKPAGQESKHQLSSTECPAPLSHHSAARYKHDTSHENRWDPISRTAVRHAEEASCYTPTMGALD